MSRVELIIRRDNGVQVSASGDVADELVADIAMTLGAILFDASAAPVTPPAAETPTEPAAS